MATELRLLAVPGIPEVLPGADLPALIGDALQRAAMRLQDGDVIVVAQKVVSKAEGAMVPIAGIVPSALAAEWAAAHGRDPAVIEVVLRESKRIVRMDRGVIVSETRHGYICANAGVDASNVPPGHVTILPRNPDESARALRQSMEARSGCRLAVIVSDTFGRPWREGVANVALGVAGLSPLLDLRGGVDRFGRLLQSTVVAVADQIAAAAELVMAKSAGTPVALVRGAGEWLGDGAGTDLLRPASTDMFR